MCPSPGPGLRRRSPSAEDAPVGLEAPDGPLLYLPWGIYTQGEQRGDANEGAISICAGTSRLLGEMAGLGTSQRGPSGLSQNRGWDGPWRPHYSPLRERGLACSPLGTGTLLSCHPEKADQMTPRPFLLLVPGALGCTQRDSRVWGTYVPILLASAYQGLGALLRPHSPCPKLWNSGQRVGGPAVNWVPGPWGHWPPKDTAVPVAFCSPRSPPRAALQRPPLGTSVWWATPVLPQEPPSRVGLHTPCSACPAPEGPGGQMPDCWLLSFSVPGRG